LAAKERKDGCKYERLQSSIPETKSPKRRKRKGILSWGAKVSICERVGKIQGIAKVTPTKGTQQTSRREVEDNERAIRPVQKPVRGSNPKQDLARGRSGHGSPKRASKNSSVNTTEASIMEERRGEPRARFRSMLKKRSGGGIQKIRSGRFSLRAQV